MLFCVKGLGSDNKQFKINKPYSIFESDSSISHMVGQECKGHKNIKELRGNCPIWKEYHKQDPDSAHKICEDKFILNKAVHTVFVPMDEEFNKVSYKLIKHTIFGELNKDIQGLHLFSTLNKSIKGISIIKTQDRNGVWLADIDFYSDVRNKPYKKKILQCFHFIGHRVFLCLKCMTLINEKKQCNEDETKYHSITDCGIKVDFIIKNNELRTVYPIYEEYEEEKN